MLARCLVLCILISAAYTEVFYFEEVQRPRLADDEASSCGWRYNSLTNSYDYGCEFPKNTGRWKEDSSSEEGLQKRRWSKRRQHDTNKVNFILINKGVNYKQRDRSKNIRHQVDIRGNCIMIVGHDNNCYGWSGNKHRGKHQTTSPAVQFQMPPGGPPAQFQHPPEVPASNWPPYEIEESHDIKVIEEVQLAPEIAEKEVAPGMEAGADPNAEEIKITPETGGYPDYPAGNENHPEIQEAQAAPNKQEAQAAPKIEEAEAEAAPKIEEAEVEAAPKIEEAEVEAAPKIEEAEAGATLQIEEAEVEAAPKIEEAEAEATPQIEQAQAYPEIEEKGAPSKIEEAQEDTIRYLNGYRKGKKKKNHKSKSKKRKNRIVVRGRERGLKTHQNEYDHLRSYITF